MKKITAAHFRNIGIIAHIDAGKTTLTERLLFFAHKIHKIGEVHDGNATMDYLEEEQKRGITITSACTTIEWKGSRVNIIDTPGHVDFNVEVERSLRVCDGAVVVFCGVNGIESQSETVWRQAEKYRLPKLVFINKIDRPGADYWQVIRDMAQRFGVIPLPLTMPSQTGEGVVDLVAERLLTFDPVQQGGEVREGDVPEAEQAECGLRRRQLIEALADLDDGIMEKYLSEEDISGDDLLAALRRATLGGRGVPIYCGSALKNMGVQPLMDGIGSFLPAPEESFSHRHVRQQMDEEKIGVDQFLGFVFKVMFEGAHKKIFLRVYNGRIGENSAVYNSRLERFEKIHKLYLAHANRHEPLTEAGTGEIVLATGLKDCVTGDTLFSGKASLRLENIDVLQPVLNVALVPGSASDTEKLQVLLDRYCVEDPTLRAFTDEDTDQLIVAGLGELHLEVVLERLRRESGVSFRYGNPQVIFLETIQAEAQAEATCSRLIGDQPHRGLVRLAVEAAGRGEGNSVTTDLPAGNQTAVAMRAMEDALQAGVLDGCVVTDVRARLLAIEPFDGGISDLGVRMAALDAMKLALSKAAPTRLEPIMDVELRMPSDYVGDCVNLLGAKNARILDVQTSDQDCRIKALAPMRQLFGFATELRSRTKGKAFYSLVFSSYGMDG
jgi:elongation factor G